MPVWHAKLWPQARRLARAKGKQKTTACSACGTLNHRKDSKKCPKYEPKPAKNKLPTWVPPYFHQSASKDAGLLELKQLSYPEFFKRYCSSSAVAQRTLESWGWLPRLKDRSCWKCGGCLKLKKKTLRCTKKRCHVQFKDGRIPFTALHAGCKHASRCPEDFLKTAYVYTVGVPKDAAVHLTGVSLKVIDIFWAWLRLICAFREYKLGEAATFELEEVETDLTHCGKKKKADKVQHVGRMLVFASRSVDPATGKRKRPSWVPWKDRTIKAGAPLPPDHYDEVSAPLSKKLKSCVHHVDGAHANKKAHWKDQPLQGQPLLDVNHSKKQFSPFAKVPLEQLGAKLAAYLAKRKSSSKTSARFRVSTILGCSSLEEKPRL